MIFIIVMFSKWHGQGFLLFPYRFSELQIHVHTLRRCTGNKYVQSL